MSTKTRNELITMALQELLVVGSGQSPEDEDVNLVDGRVDGLLGELTARGIADVVDSEQTPSEWAGPIAELLANECAPAFGKPKMPAQMKEEIEERLRVMIQRIPASDKYLKVDSALQATGRYTYNRWLSGT